MNALNVEIKFTHDLAKAAGLKYGSDMSAGVDVVACITEPITIEAGKAVLIPLGFTMLINNPHAMAILVPRSGQGHKRGLCLGNLVGVLDADYTGEVMASAWNRNHDQAVVIAPGERIAQMIFVPIYRPNFQVVDALSEVTARGAGGFGSTGV